MFIAQIYLTPLRVARTIHQRQREDARLRPAGPTMGSVALAPCIKPSSAGQYSAQMQTRVRRPAP